MSLSTSVTCRFAPTAGRRLLKTRRRYLEQRSQPQHATADVAMKLDAEEKAKFQIRDEANMRNLSRIVPTLALLCLCAPVYAANSGQTQVPINLTLTNPCNGESVIATGFVHVDTTITINGQNVHVTTVANPH